MGPASPPSRVNPPANTPDPRDALHLDLSQMSDVNKRELVVHYMGELAKVYDAQADQSRSSSNPLVMSLYTKFKNHSDEVLRLQSHVNLVLQKYETEKMVRGMNEANQRASKPESFLDDLDIGKFMEHLDAAQAHAKKMLATFKKRGRETGERRSREYLLAFEIINLIIDRVVRDEEAPR